MDLKDQLAEANRELAELQTSKELAYRRLVYPLGQTAAAAQVSQITLRNWLTRDRFQLDASVGRQAGKHRLFSLHDVFLLGVASALSRLGVPANEIHEPLATVMNVVDTLSTNVMGIPGHPVLFFWKDNDGWKHTGYYDSSNGPVGGIEPPFATIRFEPFRAIREISEGVGLALFDSREASE